MKSNEKFFRSVRKIIKQILSDEKINTGDMHLGLVDEVISDTRLKVFIDGSDRSQKIPCNPDVNFSVGDHVFVQYINKNPSDKFVICRRGI